MTLAQDKLLLDKLTRYRGILSELSTNLEAFPQKEHDLLIKSIIDQLKATRASMTSAITNYTGYVLEQEKRNG